VCSACAVWLIQLAVVGVMLIQGGAPHWWAAHRDAGMSVFVACVTVLWLLEALMWPAATFQAVSPQSLG
jgi:hypothetical protein